VAEATAQDLDARLAGWAARAAAAGWIRDDERSELAAIERARPADLFEEGAERPLVVGLFGGTGVGKSSLFNRVAGAAIARTGIERPTSHEVTVYAHRDMRLAALPPELPLERVAVHRHDNPRQRDALWIDMPDFDSTASENRELALAWLPHIDLVVYVVSPERYRDDAGWQLLRRRGERHGWLFVMNRWDEAGESQVDDLRAILTSAGFRDPVVLRTSAAGPPAVQAGDDLDALLSQVDALRSARGVQMLERNAERVRRRERARWIDRCMSRLGDDATWGALEDELRGYWQNAASELHQGMTWPIGELAGRVALRTAPASGATRLLRLLGRRPEPAPPAPAVLDAAEIRHLCSGLWDEWARRRVSDFADAAELSAHRRGVAPAPVRSAVDAGVSDAGQRVADGLAEGLQQALLRPGGTARRAARRALGALATLLPVAALAWAGYHVVDAFLAGVAGERPFLGVGFALHAVLLVATAWLLPTLLRRALAPDMRRCAATGLASGLDRGLQATGKRLASELERLLHERRTLSDDGRALRDALLAAPETAEPGPAVARLLAHAPGQS